MKSNHLNSYTATVLNYQYIYTRKDLTMNINPRLALGLGKLVRPTPWTSKFGNKVKEIWPPAIPMYQREII